MTNRASWQNPRILGTLLLVFLCGATAGALTMRLASSARTSAIKEKERSINLGGKDISLQKLKKELDLSPEQTSRLEMVLDDYTKYYQEVMEQMASVRATGKANIMRVLNDDQKKTFEKLLADLQNKK